MRVNAIDPGYAKEIVEREHYLHRKPNVTVAFGLLSDLKEVRGVVTYGVPPSHSLQKSLCPSDPKLVIELNRLWVHDDEPRNSESWFVSRTLRLMPPFIVVSYADTAYGHEGYIYRALNFNYAGRTDATRPLYDYILLDNEGKHSRNVKWGTPGSVKVLRSAKQKYWTVTGTKIERNGRQVPLAAFKLGDRGQAIALASNGVASKIEAVGP